MNQLILEEDPVKKRILLICGIILITAMISLAVGSCAEPEPEPAPAPAPEPAPAPAETKTLNIGLPLGLSGFFSVREVPDLNQAQICADIINEQGGITVNGQKYTVKLIAEDTKSTMDGVTAALNKLVYDKEIDFIIGPTAFFAGAAGTVCEPNQVLRFITWCVNTPGEVDETTPYAFMAGNGSILTSVAVIKYFRDTYPDVKKLAFVSPDDGAPQILLPKLEKLLAAEGMSFVGEPILYPNEMVDFAPIVAKLNAIEEADAILMQNGLVPHIGAIVKGLREAGNYKPYGGSLPARISQVMTITGEDALKDVFTIGLTPGDPNMAPLAKEIIDRVVEQYGADYQLEMTAPNCLWVLKEAIESCQSLDPTVVKEELESMGEVETIWGTAKICGEETFGIKHVVASPQSVQICKDGVETCAGWVDLGVIP
jgi:branched-chain amino acid transport system substrate-binding protein